MTDKWDDHPPELVRVPKVICFILRADPEEDGTDGFFVAVFQRMQVLA